MALIRCRNCGHEISDTTKKCIHCGTKIKTAVSEKKEKKQFDSSVKTKEIVKHENTQKHNKKKTFNKIILIIMFILLCVIALLFISLKLYNDKFVSIEFKNGNFSKVIKIEKGDTIQELKISTRKGYKFNGWYLGNKKYNFNKKVTSNITLVGKWLKIYSVEFDSNGGSSINIQKVTKGEKVTKPENPISDGYDFVNWYLNDKEYNFDDKVTSNIKLVAKWNEKQKIESSANSNEVNNNKTTNRSNQNNNSSGVINNNYSTEINKTHCYHMMYFTKNDLERIDNGNVNVGDYIILKGEFSQDVNISITASDPSMVEISGNFVGFQKTGNVIIYVKYSGCEDTIVQYSFEVK